ncbi:MAG TPA: phage tail protein [Caulobacteraceae bacterium]|jgi:phage tail-like protein|nr:phage tail protein [Caulobacteraceae bacterium]
MLKLAVLGMVLSLAATAGASPLTRSGEVVKHRAGGDPGLSRKSPGRMKYEPVTLERGLTQDKGFANWAGKVHHTRHRRRHGH